MRILCCCVLLAGCAANVDVSEPPRSEDALDSPSDNPRRRGGRGSDESEDAGVVVPPIVSVPNRFRGDYELPLVDPAYEAQLELHCRDSESPIHIGFTDLYPFTETQIGNLRGNMFGRFHTQTGFLESEGGIGHVYRVDRASYAASPTDVGGFDFYGYLGYYSTAVDLHVSVEAGAARALRDELDKTNPLSSRDELYACGLRPISPMMTDVVFTQLDLPTVGMECEEGERRATLVYPFHAEGIAKLGGFYVGRFGTDEYGRWDGKDAETTFYRASRDAVSTVMSEVFVDGPETEVDLYGESTRGTLHVSFDKAPDINISGTFDGVFDDGTAITRCFHTRAPGFVMTPIVERAARFGLPIARVVPE